MGKSHSPLLGFNNNVRHKNRVFHIQTEDSGIKHPHIITHLFMDGGRILKSVKKSYAEHVGTDTMQDTVRQMMKEQHKAMFIALRDGQFDAVVDEQVAAKAKYDANAPAAPPKGSKTTSKADASTAAASLPPAAPDIAEATQAAALAAAPVAPEAIASVDDAAKEAAPVSHLAASTPHVQSIKPSASPAPSAEEARAAAPPTSVAAATTSAASPPPPSAKVDKSESKRPPARATQAGFPAPPLRASGAAPPPLPSRTSQHAAPVSAPPPLVRRLSQSVPSPAPPPLPDAAPVTASVSEAPRRLTPGGKNRLVILPEPDEQPPTTTRDPDRGPPPSLDIDLDATPGVSAAALFGTNDLPPPPDNLFKKEITSTSTYRTVDHGGGYRGMDANESRPPPQRPKSNPPQKAPPIKRNDSMPATPAAARPVAQKQPAPHMPAPASTTQSTHPSGSPGRYAPARPATIFGQPRGKGSLFGDDLVSDKSLDEVILSYLAEDLEQSPKKK